MRLDKFLKVSRLIKQRSRAKQLCDAGAVKINRVPVKASYQVQINDVVSVVTGDKEVTAEIIEIPSSNVSRKKARELVRVSGIKLLDET